jgi:heme-degrading monooxygenase HmoA
VPGIDRDQQESYPHGRIDLFARVTIFQAAPDSVDGPIRFSVRRASQGVEELTGFLGLFDLSDRGTGHSVIVTLWATKEARDSSAEFARNATKRVAEAGDEQVISMRDYEVGHHVLSPDFPTS